MNPEKVLTIALRTLPPDAWQSERISDIELLAAAAASLAAYAHPADFELKSSKRAIVIPSETFRSVVGSGRRMLDGVLPEADAPIRFVETRYFVAAIVKVRDFVLVGYRGTADGYDLFLDLNFRKGNLPRRSGIQPKVHAGFLKAFLEGVPHVHEALRELEPYKHLIGAGHSLGGAICMLHNAASNSFSNAMTNPPGIFDGESKLHAMKACITFGSPKVGNIEFALFCPWATNVYRRNDPVPLLPMGSLGYERQPIGLPLPDEISASPGRWRLPFRRKRRMVTFAEHLIEGYVRLCSARAKVAIE